MPTRRQAVGVLSAMKRSRLSSSAGVGSLRGMFRLHFVFHPKSKENPMSDLEDRLNRAIRRGQGSREERGRIEGEKKATQEDMKNRHSQLRLALSDHIEKCLRQLTDHFPGFDFSTVVNEDGWGARISRDDVRMQRGSNNNQYSRFEMLIRPWSDTNILELVTKGTIRNKESLNRNNFRMLPEATEDGFREVIDGLVVEFAEQYAAQE